MNKTARFLWLLEVLEVDPDDQILEIGCGVGLAVEQIAPKLKHGSITAIDRSLSMISKAMVRNEKFIESRTAEFIQIDLTALPPGAHFYNKIFAFNVNLFWTKKSIVKEIQIIESHLSKKGRLYLFYQPPSKSGIELVTNVVEDNLRAHGFDVLNTLYEEAVSSCCIVSRPGL